MKVLQIYNLHRYRGGADNATLATAELVAERGIDVRRFSYSSKDIPPTIPGKVRAFASGIYGRAACADLRHVLDEFSPDVVHAHKLYPLISPWVLPLCAERGIPVVMSIYDYQLTCPVATHTRNGKHCIRCLGGREYQAIVNNCRGSITESAAYALRHAVARHFELVAKAVSRYIVPTKFAGEWLSRYAGVATDNIALIPYFFDIPATPACAETGGYIAYVGRLSAEKGIATLLEAARLTGLPVRLAGDARHLSAADRLENVEIVETHSRDETHDFFRGARMLIVPSTWFETFPLVIGEAMSHGVPVIASRIGGLPEIVEDGVTGAIFETGDANDLADKIQALWADPQRCRTLGLAGYEKLNRIASRDVFFERLMGVYEDVVT